ncbi:MAG: hypothetical protein PHY74_03960 [Candidatus Bathyarchaeota archaeon]|jgi:hypothetical protein|nr:hypothetical protein [Candidatus Bathyarchaeota archaeon]MDD4325209.1 hypothetical protein [Candidatus Bathyarchaeota archaeon]MDI9577631.1 hypothetical protein [Thermoproteota archaeon]MDT8781408.1 hypothetical protein [Candidatus Bathyarchaeota archaeon]NLD65442.1 hypothetical protein [Thermoproteota archaeon]
MTKLGIKKFLIPVFLIIILIGSIVGLNSYYLNTTQEVIDSKPYVGIAFCGKTTDEAKTQIDRTKNYTNLFILDTGRSELSRNQTAVIEICNYAVESGLNIIVNLGITSPYENDTTTWFWDQPMSEIKKNWTERWGNQFLGVYYNDEPGGIQLDGYWVEFYEQHSDNFSKVEHPAIKSLQQIYLKMLYHAENKILPQDYDLEADFFVNYVLKEGDPGLAALNAAGITTFTSDYGLYWFDYLGGYEVLLAQLGWNASVAQQIALVKGAARLQDKEWGTIITWKYGEPPFLDNGEQIYNQMLSSYQAGADYIVIFNYATLGNESAPAMVEEHYLALERFWKDIHYKKQSNLSTPEAVLILPSNYGWGMRHHDDTIWGFWPSDDKTEQIGTVMGKLLAIYGVTLDIVYEDARYPVSKMDYKQVYYWNTTIVR